MSRNKEYFELSHEDNARHYNDYVVGGKYESQAKTWLDSDTVDAWRHKRMYSALDPFLKTEQLTWLTIGDGRFGKDARYIYDKGGDVTATDIDDSLLREAYDNGFIYKYAKENAESLSFCDSSFDYVFCKESYHHFPRPMLALYEMLRVASRGVILIEPNDRFISYSLTRTVFAAIFDFVLSLVGKNNDKFGFEDFGNYVYTISRRELEKVAMGLNYHCLAFKGMNDSYTYGVEFEKLADNGSLLRKVKFKILVRDLLVKLGIIDYAMLVAIVFKHPPSDPLTQSLKEDGFEMVELSVNPNAHGS